MVKGDFLSGFLSRGFERVVLVDVEVVSDVGVSVGGNRTLRCGVKEGTLCGGVAFEAICQPF